ncbi:MAG: hypothetical protein ACFFG0_17735 [Candidatus Thorarchaeota archaeon]
MDEASKTCYLGYYAYCSFTSYRTLILFVMVIFGTIFLIKFINYLKRQYNKLVAGNKVLKSLKANY